MPFTFHLNFGLSRTDLFLLRDDILILRHEVLYKTNFRLYACWSFYGPKMLCVKIYLIGLKIG